VRDRLPWPPLAVSFANGRDTPWQPLPARAGLLEIAASVNGVPVRAVVDSGAQITAVDAGLARRLGLSPILAAPLIAYGVSGRAHLTHTVRLDLAAAGLAVPHLRAAVLDLASVADASGRDFQLIIGRDVLSRLVLDADLPARRVRFLTPAAYRPAHDALSAPLIGATPTTAVRIEDAAPLNLLVDTGATGVPGALRNGRAAGRPDRSGPAGGARPLGQPERPQSRDDRARPHRRMGALTLHDVPVQVYAPAAHSRRALGPDRHGPAQPVPRRAAPAGAPARPHAAAVIVVR
jgi:hypothetical protein